LPPDGVAVTELEVQVAAEKLAMLPFAAPPPEAVRVGQPVLLRVTLQVGETLADAVSVIVHVAVPEALACGPSEVEKVVDALVGLSALIPPVQDQE